MCLKTIIEPRLLAIVKVVSDDHARLLESSSALRARIFARIPLASGFFELSIAKMTEFKLWGIDKTFDSKKTCSDARCLIYSFCAWALFIGLN